MDTNEQKYRKVITTYRSPVNSIICEYPIAFEEYPDCRNLKYLVIKERLSANLPYYDSFYDDTIDQIKSMINDKNIERKMLGLRLSRSLPFIHRIKVLENNQNELINLISSNLSISKTTISSVNEFSYEITSDLIELTLSIYELTHFSDEIYFDVNQKIISLISRIMEQIYCSDKNVVRNCYQVLRAILMSFGPKQQSNMANKLIGKVINILIYSSSFVTNTQVMQQSLTPTQKLRVLILKCREYEIRVRSRLFKGICLFLTYIDDLQQQIYQLAVNQIFTMVQNISECDTHLDCFCCLRYLLSINKVFHQRNSILKRWSCIFLDISFKKQYWDHFITILSLSQQCPPRLKYSLSTSLMEYTRYVNQQFSRFLLYKQSCKSLIEVISSASLTGKYSNLLLNIFLHGWFIDRINQDSDLFRSQFLISLLNQWFKIGGNYHLNQLHDLLSLCHRLLDWKCNTKEQTYIPTIKFAFDIYLSFLTNVAQQLQDQMATYINELVQRCNEQNIYFLFKIKLISTLIQLQWYKQNATASKLNLNFLEGEIRPFMMPKNPKPIFDYEYSLTADGEIQSRKQIEYIKVIMNMLNYLPQVHNIEDKVSKLVMDYHAYLSQLQQLPNSNRQLVNCLMTLQADHYLSDCQRNFLLSLIDKVDHRGNNSQLTLGYNIVYSPYEQFNYEDEVNILGIMSPIQLSIKILPHSSYSSVYLQIRKSQWVSITNLRVVISSGVEKKQIPFESSILQIKIDRVGILHFEVRTAQGPQLLLGSGQFKLKRKLKWQSIDHLKFIDGIRTKAYFKNNTIKDGTYLSYYFGQPVVIQVLRTCNEVVIALSSRQVWGEMQQAVVDMIQELTDGTALML